MDVDDVNLFCFIFSVLVVLLARSLPCYWVIITPVSKPPPLPPGIDDLADVKKLLKNFNDWQSLGL